MTVQEYKAKFGELVKEMEQEYDSDISRVIVNRRELYDNGASYLPNVFYDVEITFGN